MTINFKEGILIPIDKPYGVTSFKALAHIRYLCSHALGGKVKMGHAGTLDPLATGVLVLATGKKTKQIETLQQHTKEYVATIQLGATTVSYDMEHPVSATFIGEIEQIPPTYSAVKVNGVRAYDVRRNGEHIELKPKHVRIDEIEVVSFDAEKMQLVLRVVCGKGTYIRALARDLGRALSSGAYLTSLRRTQVGDVRVENCLSYDHFEEWLAQQTIEKENK